MDTDVWSNDRVLDPQLENTRSEFPLVKPSPFGSTFASLVLIL